MPRDSGAASWGIVGLGNPGSKYATTRHNAGWFAIEALYKQLASPSRSEKFGCEFARAKLEDGIDLLCIRPLQFMNRSGESAAPLLRYFKIELPNLIVLQDEADLELGALKVKRGGSGAGHHGIDDLSIHLGSEDFYRVRIGVGRPRGADRAGSGRDIASYLLSAPPGPELEILYDTAKLAAEMALEVVRRGAETASQKYARRAFPKP